VADSLEIQVTRLQVLLEESDKADKRHEAEMTVLDSKINACFKRVDALHIGLTELKTTLDGLVDTGRNGKAKRWGVYMVIIGLVAERAVSLVIGG